MILNLIIYALFVTRISYMFTEENGMYQIFEKIRTYFGVYKLENGETIRTKEGFIGDILSCFYCFSMYPSIFIILLHIINTTLSFYLAIPFALSMITILVYERLLNV